VFNVWARPWAAGEEAVARARRMGSAPFEPDRTPGAPPNERAPGVAGPRTSRGESFIKT
jgi:hypothetical protein